MTNLVILPTKNRLIPMCCVMQNFCMQAGDFDIYVADMGDNLLDNYLRGAAIRLTEQGHNTCWERVVGKNQMVGDQRGLEYAQARGYDTCFISDDDLIYAPGFLETGFRYMAEHPEVGILVGHTFDAFRSVESQTAPPQAFDDPMFSGLLKDNGGGYHHCIFRNPVQTEPREYEMVIGAFFFRTKDVLKVGGFPQHLSEWGFRGEMMTHIAVHWLGRKVMLHPLMWSWHYNYPSGGLKIGDDELKARCREHDMGCWDAFIKRGTPDTSDARGIR